MNETIESFARTSIKKGLARCDGREKLDWALSKVQNTSGNKARLKKTKVCLTPDCGRPVKSHGLCMLCDQSAARRIRSGLATEREMADAGLMIASSWKGPRIGRSPGKFRTWALTKLDKRRKESMTMGTCS